MVIALLFGLAASSALVIGAAVGARWSPPKRLTGVLLAFASGALISALAFELFEEAFHLGGAVRAGLGLLAGAATFVAVDTALDRYITGKEGPEEREVVAVRRARRRGPGAAGGGDAGRRAGEPGAGHVAGHRRLAVAAGGDLLLQPAGVAGRRGLHAGGRAERPSRDARPGSRAPSCSPRRWCWVAESPAVLSEHVLAVALAFAGGAVLASLADTLMPEAFEHGRPLNAFATAAGFFLSFVLAA